MSNKPKGTILVTGANGGLGSAIVSKIVSSSLGAEYHGVYTVRNPASVDALKDTLRKASKHNSEIVKMDLASLSNVREAAAGINKRVAEGSLPRIRALILNAAFQDSTELSMSPDGFAMDFQVNHLAQFLFTLLVLESMDKEHGRVVFVGSWSHDVNDPRNGIGAVAGAYKGLTALFTDTERLARGKWSTPAEDSSLHNGYRRYGATKLCELMFMHELQARLDQDPALANISVLGVDPGGMGTGLLRRGTWTMRMMSKTLPAIAAVSAHIQPNGVLRPTSKSATDVLAAAFQIPGHPRALYMNGSEEKETGPEARDEKKRDMLWHDSVRYAELREGETALQNWR